MVLKFGLHFIPIQGAASSTVLLTNFTILQPAVSNQKKMSAVRAFIFELDGAVAGTSQLQRDAFVNTFNAAVAKDALTGELHQLYLEGRTVAGKLAVCRDLFPALKWSDADFASAFSSAVVGAIATSKLSFTALGGLKWAKENGITVAAYSRSSRVVADALITALADATLFSAVVCADEVAAGKSGYEAVAAIVGTSHAVFDIEGADLAAANAAGAVTVPVYDNLDITPAYLQSVAENGKAPAAAARLRIVVPMAGLGSRFAKDGFYIQVRRGAGAESLADWLLGRLDDPRHMAWAMT